MEEQEKTELSTEAKTGIAVVAVGAIWYYVSTRKERAKRKKIQEWARLNESATTAFKERLTKILEDPNTTSEEFWTAWKEETAFMKLINDQPMY